MSLLSGLLSISEFIAAIISQVNTWTAKQTFSAGIAITGGDLDLNGDNILDYAILTTLAPTELTIATGVITQTQSWHLVDTQDDDPTDDLDTINTTIARGHLCIFSSANAARDPTFKDTATLAMAGDFTLTTVSDLIELFATFSGSNRWNEVSRSDNG